MYGIIYLKNGFPIRNFNFVKAKRSSETGQHRWHIVIHNCVPYIIEKTITGNVVLTDPLSLINNCAMCEAFYKDIQTLSLETWKELHILFGCDTIELISQVKDGMEWRCKADTHPDTLDLTKVINSL